ncbi:MAG: AAA family ATPase, partial [Elusimicrobia bacterium]|nr:AAA family ATPase [Elusimicrobiota bacterium]
MNSPTWSAVFLNRNRIIRCLLALTIVFNSVALSLAEAGFWQKRKEALSVHASETLPQNLFLSSRLPQEIHSYLNIPSGYGEVKKTVRAEKPGRPWVILLQDAHDFQEAQENISRILSGFSANEGKGPVFVGLEGAAGPLRLEPYRRLPGADLRRKIADFLLKGGFLTGAEHFGFIAEREPPLFGVEDIDIYRNNITAFQKSVPVRAEAEQRLGQWRNELEALKERVLPPKLAELDHIREPFLAGRSSLSTYIKGLAGFLEPAPSRFPQTAKFIKVFSLEKSLDFQRVEHERARLIEELVSRLSEAEKEALSKLAPARHDGLLGQVMESAGLSMEGFPHFSVYMQCVSAAEQIDPALLRQETDVFEKDVLSFLEPTTEQMEAFAVSEDIGLASKLLSNNLTAEEWAKYLRRRESINEIPRRLKVLGGHDPAADGRWKEVREPFEDFYRCATERNKALAANFIRGLEGRGEREKNTDEAFAVLVAGGFHTDALMGLLSERGYSTVVVAPRMEPAGKGTEYLAFFTGEKRPLDKLMLGDRLYLNPPLGTAENQIPEYAYLGEVLQRTIVTLYGGLSLAACGGLMATKEQPALMKAVENDLQDELKMPVHVKRVGRKRRDFLRGIVNMGPQRVCFAIARKGSKGERRWERMRRKHQGQDVMEGMIDEVRILIYKGGPGFFQRTKSFVRRQFQGAFLYMVLGSFAVLAAQAGGMAWEWSFPFFGGWQSMWVSLTQVLGFTIRGILTCPNVDEAMLYGPYVQFGSWGLFYGLVSAALLVSAFLITRITKKNRYAVLTPLLAIMVLLGAQEGGHAALDSLWPPVQHGESRVRIMHVTDEERRAFRQVILGLPKAHIEGLASILYTPTTRKIGGVHYPSLHQIDLASNVTREYSLRTLSHEIAHNLFHGSLTLLEKMRWQLNHTVSRGPNDFVDHYAATNANEDFAQTYEAYVNTPWVIFDKALRSNAMFEKVAFLVPLFTRRMDDGRQVLRVFRPDGVYEEPPLTAASSANLAPLFMAVFEKWPAAVKKAIADGQARGWGYARENRFPFLAVAQGLPVRDLVSLISFDAEFGDRVFLYVHPGLYRGGLVQAFIGRLKSALSLLEASQPVTNLFIHVMPEGVFVNGDRVGELSGFPSGPVLAVSIQAAVASRFSEEKREIYLRALVLHGSMRSRIDQAARKFINDNAGRFSDPVFSSRVFWALTPFYQQVEAYEADWNPELPLDEAGMLRREQIFQAHEISLKNSLQKLLDAVPAGGNYRSWWMEGKVWVEKASFLMKTFAHFLVGWFLVVVPMGGLARLTRRFAGHEKTDAGIEKETGWVAGFFKRLPEGDVYHGFFQRVTQPFTRTFSQRLGGTVVFGTLLYFILGPPTRIVAAYLVFFAGSLMTLGFVDKMRTQSRFRTAVIVLSAIALLLLIDLFVPFIDWGSLDSWLKGLPGFFVIGGVQIAYEKDDAKISAFLEKTVNAGDEDSLAKTEEALSLIQGYDPVRAATLFHRLTAPQKVRIIHHASPRTLGLLLSGLLILREDAFKGDLMFFEGILKRRPEGAAVMAEALRIQNAESVIAVMIEKGWIEDLSKELYYGGESPEPYEGISQTVEETIRMLSAPNSRRQILWMTKLGLVCQEGLKIFAWRLMHDPALPLSLKRRRILCLKTALPKNTLRTLVHMSQGLSHIVLGIPLENVSANHKSTIAFHKMIQDLHSRPGGLTLIGYLSEDAGKRFLQGDAANSKTFFASRVRLKGIDLLRYLNALEDAFLDKFNVSFPLEALEAIVEGATGRDEQDVVPLLERLTKSLRDLAERAQKSSKTEIDSGEILRLLPDLKPREPGTPSQKTPLLDKYGTDLTSLARAGKLDPVVGRQPEIEKALRVLNRRKSNNVLLIGEPGVGKTAIAEGLAQKIAAGDVPPNLQGKRLVVLDLTRLVAGTTYRGDFEERVMNLLKEIENASGEILLFVDEFHTLIGAGQAEGSIDASAMVRAALQKGAVRIIGATTLDEYRKYVEKDNTFARFFQTVQVDPPGREDTLRILHGVRRAYEDFHGVLYSPEALRAAVDLTERYIPHRFQPDKALDAIDLAGAAKNVLPGLNGPGRIVTAEDIARVVSRWSGVPVERVREEEAERLLHLGQNMRRRVVGQDSAIETIAHAIRKSRLKLADPRRPIGSFIFVGQTGVGKTEVAKALAE